MDSIDRDLTVQYPNEIVKYSDAPLNISTYTIIVNLTEQEKNLHHMIDLYLLSRFIPIYDENSDETKTLDGCIIGINNYTENPSYTDLPRGKVDIKKKYPTSVFNNQLTVLYKYHGFKKINIKIFSNGKLHMTGINDYPWEVNHASTYIINLIKYIKYQIICEKSAFTKVPFNYLLFYDKITNKIEYYRNNILDYNIQRYIEGNKYDDSTLDTILKKPLNTWLSKSEIKHCIDHYNKYVDRIMSDLSNIRNIIVLNLTYSLQLRESIISKLTVYNKLKSIKKNATYYMDDNFRNYMESFVDTLIRIIKNYKKRINNLHETDNYVVSKLYSIYPNLKKKTSMRSSINYYKRSFTKEYNKYKDNPDKQNKLYIAINKQSLMNKLTFAIYNTKIEFIKSEFNTGYGHILNKMSDLLMTPQYNIFNTYDPNERHAGILVRFYYNEKYLQYDKPGSCYCEDFCRKQNKNEREDQCVCLTIVIFRTGNITITSAKNKEQIIYAYNFIKKFIEDNKETICYNINKEEVNTSKLKKLIKKEPMYIKRDNITY